MIEVGTLELNRNPDNYFAEVEQSAFAPAHVVPGIDFSPDKMLQARIMAYTDAHRYRLGGNHETLPVNRPHSPVENYQRDGFMRHDGNHGSKLNYEPNSFNGPQQADASYNQAPFPVDGDGARYNHRDGNDDYTQAGDLFRLMSTEEKERLMDNIAGTMKDVPQFIVERQLEHFTKADPAYGAGIAARLGMAVPAAT
jgi:catalase